MDNKPQKYGLFDKVSLSVIGYCELDKKTHPVITRSNQHIQEISIHFDGTLNNVSHMIFSANQEQNEFYNFKEILLQLNKSYLILAIIGDVE